MKEYKRRWNEENGITRLALILVIIGIIAIASIAIIAVIMLNRGKEKENHTVQKNTVTSNQTGSSNQALSLEDFKVKRFPDIFQNQKLVLVPPQSYYYNHVLKVNPNKNERVVVSKIDLESMSTKREEVFQYITPDQKLVNVYVAFYKESNGISQLGSLQKITTIDNIDIYANETRKTKYVSMRSEDYIILISMSTYTAEVEDKVVIEIAKCFEVVNPIEKGGIIADKESMSVTRDGITISLENVYVIDWYLNEPSNNSMMVYSSYQTSQDDIVKLHVRSDSIEDVKNKLERENSIFSETSQTILKEVEIEGKKFYIEEYLDKRTQQSYYHSGVYLDFGSNLIEFWVNTNGIRNEEKTQEKMISLIKTQIINQVVF